MLLGRIRRSRIILPVSSRHGPVQDRGHRHLFQHPLRLRKARRAGDARARVHPARPLATRDVLPRGCVLLPFLVARCLALMWSTPQGTTTRSGESTRRRSCTSDERSSSIARTCPPGPSWGTSTSRSRTRTPPSRATGGLSVRLWSQSNRWSPLTRRSGHRRQSQGLPGVVRTGTDVRTPGRVFLRAQLLPEGNGTTASFLRLVSVGERLDSH